MADAPTMDPPRLSPPKRGLVWPSLDDLRAVAPSLDGATTIPLVRELMADLETPVSAFLKLWRGGPAFLLESIEGGERLARYSFIGSDPLETLTLRPVQRPPWRTVGAHTEPCPDPLAAIAALIAPFTAAELPGLALASVHRRRRRLPLVRSGPHL
jgi:anthranilate synthase component 1